MKSKVVLLIGMTCALVAHAQSPVLSPEVLAAQKFYNQHEPEKKSWGYAPRERTALDVKTPPRGIVVPEDLLKSAVRGADGMYEDGRGGIVLRSRN